MDAGPQFKQLGLFQAKGYMSDAARWPRGYTPERQRDVMGALRVGTDSPVIQPVDPHPNSWGAEDRAWALRQNAHHERGVIDTIARSTVPAAHLRERSEGTYRNQEGQARLGHIVVNGKMTQDASAAAFFTEHGIQHKEQSYDTLTPGRSIVLASAFGEHRGELSTKSSVQRDNRLGNTLIHELGHHDSAADDDWEAHLDRGEHWDYNTQSLPAEEAYADDYAKTHNRIDTRGGRRQPKSFQDYSDTAVGRLPEYYENRKTLSPVMKSYLAAGGGRRVPARRKPIAASPQFEQAGLF